MKVMNEGDIVKDKILINSESYRFIVDVMTFKQMKGDIVKDIISIHSECCDFQVNPRCQHTAPPLCLQSTAVIVTKPRPVT